MEFLTKFVTFISNFHKVFVEKVPFLSNQKDVFLKNNLERM